MCVSRGGRGKLGWDWKGWWGWRRQHPGRTFGTEFPAALASLLLSFHKSLPAGSVLLLPGDSRFFPKAMPKLAPTPSPCQMTPSSATASPYLSFPRAVVLVSASPLPPSVTLPRRHNAQCSMQQWCIRLMMFLHP